MKRRIEKGLWFGNVIRLGAPAWVARRDRTLTQIAEQIAAPFPAASPGNAALSGLARR